MAYFNDRTFYSYRIYHYVRVHKYAPPDDFIEAVMNGIRPPDPRYFERLKELGIPWHGAPIWRGAFRHVKMDEPPDDFIRVELPDENFETP
jgi:hypothetical protein